MTDKLTIEKAREIVKSETIDKEANKVPCQPGLSAFIKYIESKGYIQAWEEQEKKIQEQGKIIGRLAKALEPFIKEVKAWRPVTKDDFYLRHCDGRMCPNAENTYIRVGDMRNAEKTLSTVPEEYRKEDRG